jgi:hypothetical protein
MIMEKKEKIYHIYDKENNCLASVLTEEEFLQQWGQFKNQDQLEYEELDIDKSQILGSSY